MARRFKIFSRCDGVGAVEFAIVVPILTLLVLGGMDLAQGYYIDHVITNASREGARYGAKYAYPNDPPTSDQISAYIKNTLNYNRYNFNDFQVSGSYSGASPTRIVTVTVQAKIYWWILGSFLPNPKQLAATTAMTVEGP
ncbi:MAG: pilus assembly protein [Deltaproteobacteria bacterium]|nr:pilus assembly protein [Deltaproteobacteria bacterium]